MLLVFSTLTIVAQTRTITGRVLDGDFNNEPLIGAAIRMEFSDKNHPAAGTVSDIDGNFSISVSDKVKGFYVTFVGYATQYVKVGDKSNYNVIEVP